MHHGEAWELNDIADTVSSFSTSLPSQTLEQMAGIAASVTQIDHHASARREWAGRLLPDGLGGESFEHPALPLSIRFNLDKSGARLAWEHFHPDTPVPLAILHIEDQDMWRFMLPGTRAFCRAIRLLPFDFEHWHGLIVETSTPESERYRKTIDQGQSIETFFQREVERLARGSLCMTAQLRGEPVDGLQAVRHGQAVICDGEYLACRCRPGHQCQHAVCLRTGQCAGRPERQFRTYLATGGRRRGEGFCARKAPRSTYRSSRRAMAAATQRGRFPTARRAVLQRSDPDFIFCRKPEFGRQSVPFETANKKPA
jgi:hypothetical protein